MIIVLVIVCTVASRTPIIQSASYCFYPRQILKSDGERLVVPCGRCNGCLLHRANLWAMRLGNEIESQGNAIFATFTYSNKYLPKLYKDYYKKGDFLSWRWISDHPDNIRFDGVKDVPRQDGIVIDVPYPSQEITHWNGDNVCYSSKRDFQLFLKNVRKQVNEKFPNDTDKRIRYFAISEYGPTTHRSHIHSVIFAPSREIGDFLLKTSLFENWKMQDSWTFFNNTHYCDSGARGYLTQYLTCTSDNLPIHQTKAIAPFRLSSKNPSIGFSQFDKEEVSENIGVGVNTYTKSVSRLNERFILEYPKDYLRSVWPKCYRYRELPYPRLYSVYAALFVCTRNRTERERAIVFSRLRAFMHPLNFNASLKCLRYCEQFNSHPFHYLYLLDMMYYKADMQVLSKWYCSLENNWSWRKLFEYTNFIDWFWRLRHNELNERQILMLDWLCQSCGFTIDDLREYRIQYEDVAFHPDQQYIDNVNDIVSDMVKTSKYNELTGNAPTIV